MLQRGDRMRDGMNGSTKVLVVDTGRRTAGDLLSTELAELGFSSVTASFEAANDVLAVIDRPAAIFLNMPQAREAAQRDEFLLLAAALRNEERTSGIPVIEWDPETAPTAGGISAFLRSEVGPPALSEPER